MHTDPAQSAESPEKPAAPPPSPAVVAPAMLAALLVLAAVLGFGAATKDSWLPLLRGPQSPDFSLRIATLEIRVKTLEERPVPAPSPAPGAASAPAPAVDKAALPAVAQTALEDLARRLAESESRAADLARRLAAVESARTQQPRADATAQALILAVGQMRDAAAAGRPFAKEREALRALAAADPAVAGPIAGPVERTAALAEKGVPTIAALRERFDAVARAVAIAERGGDDADWIQRMKGRVFSLVAVRRTDGAAPAGTPHPMIMAAEKAQAAGQLAHAHAALETLSGPPAVPARDWLGAARARVDLDAALAEMHARAVAVLAGGG